MKKKEELQDSPVEPISYAKKKSFTDVKGWVKEFRFNSNSDKVLVVEMYHRNQTKSHFLIFSKNDSFVWNKKRYIIDDQYKYYDNTTKNWALAYHEDLSLPVDIKIEPTKLKSKLKDIGSEVRTSINPESLEIYMKSSFIQKIMRGEELEKVFKRLILLGMVSALASVIVLLIIVQQSGALDKLM